MQVNGNVLYPGVGPLGNTSPGLAPQVGVLGASFAGTYSIPFEAQTDVTSFTYTLLGPTTSNTGAFHGVIGYRLGGGPGLTFAKVVTTGAFEYYANSVNRSIGTSHNLNAARSVFAIKNGLTLSYHVNLATTAEASYTTGQLDQNAASVRLTGDDQFPSACPSRSTVGIIHSRALTPTERAMLHDDPFCMLKG